MPIMGVNRPYRGRMSKPQLTQLEKERIEEEELNRHSLDPYPPLEHIRVALFGSDGAGRRSLARNFLQPSTLQVPSFAHQGAKAYGAFSPTLLPPRYIRCLRLYANLISVVLEVYLPDSFDHWLESEEALASTHGVVLLYDVTDRKSFGHAQWLTRRLRNSDEVRGSDCVPLALLGTKADLAGAYDEAAYPRELKEEMAHDPATQGLVHGRQHASFMAACQRGVCNHRRHCRFYGGRRGVACAAAYVNDANPFGEGTSGGGGGDDGQVILYHHHHNHHHHHHHAHYHHHHHHHHLPHHRRMVGLAEGALFAANNDLTFFEVSARTGLNVQLAFTRVVDELLHTVIPEDGGAGEADLETYGHEAAMRLMFPAQQSQQPAPVLPTPPFPGYDDLRFEGKAKEENEDENEDEDLDEDFLDILGRRGGTSRQEPRSLPKAVPEGAPVPVPVPVPAAVAAAAPLDPRADYNCASRESGFIEEVGALGGGKGSSQLGYFPRVPSAPIDIPYSAAAAAENGSASCRRNLIDGLYEEGGGDGGGGGGDNDDDSNDGNDNGGGDHAFGNGKYIFGRPSITTTTTATTASTTTFATPNFNFSSHHHHHHLKQYQAVLEAANYFERLRSTAARLELTAVQAKIEQRIAALEAFTISLSGHPVGVDSSDNGGGSGNGSGNGPRSSGGVAPGTTAARSNGGNSSGLKSVKCWGCFGSSSSSSFMNIWSKSFAYVWKRMKGFCCCCCVKTSDDADNAETEAEVEDIGRSTAVPGSPPVSSSFSFLGSARATTNGKPKGKGRANGRPSSGSNSDQDLANVPGAFGRGFRYADDYCLCFVSEPLLGDAAAAEDRQPRVSVAPVEAVVMVVPNAQVPEVDPVPSVPAVPAAVADDDGSDPFPYFTAALAAYAAEEEKKLDSEVERIFDSALLKIDAAGRGDGGEEEKAKGDGNGEGNDNNGEDNDPEEDDGEDGDAPGQVMVVVVRMMMMMMMM
ncbi:hypothetical protein TYRP_022454 [Tyrophagus putrescentiae]|nr:hypothetical protein TYRP_022454 [Tyrophagus putrescentiae]